MDEKTAVIALTEVVDKYVREHNPPFTPRPEIPEGIRLEIHPAVYHMLLRNMAEEYISMKDPLERFPLPVKVTTDVPKYGWRLVIITEEVINGGVMPHRET
jgi:hypothetical protein